MSSNNRLATFDDYIESARESWSCPGVAVAIVQEDDILYQNTFGLRDIESNDPMTVDTRFAMASVTKSFTAMSVALLVDEGKIEWDKPVREYIPEFILDDNYVTQNITVRDMLSHRTGLPRHDLAAWRIDMPRADFIKKMRHFKFSATFRERFQYNNLMYYATAYLVEQVSGKKWETFVHERIFDKLGMVASNFVPESPQDSQITSSGYRVDRDEDGNPIGHIKMPYGKHTELSPSSAGALFSTLADLTQWLKVHVNDGRVGDVQLVSPDNLVQMHNPHTIIPASGMTVALMGTNIATYGMGWFVEPYRGNTLVHHGGNVEGFSLIIGFIPQQKIGIIGLTNVQGLPLRDVILYEAADRALKLPEKDWNAKYHGIFDPLIKGQAQGKKNSASERIDSAPQTHSLESYAGTYEADGYPDFGVRLHEGALQASTIGSLDWSTLRHYHYNIFEWHLTDFDSWMKVRFEVNNNGEVASIMVPIEPAVDPVRFVRKPLKVSADILEKLLGEYATEVEGLAFIISAREDKVYITQTGGTANEIKAYKVEDNLVGFRDGNMRFEFSRETGDFKHMQIIAPNATMPATKKS